MRRAGRALVFVGCFACALPVGAQDALLDTPESDDEEEEEEEEGAEGFDPHEGQAPGLGRAASDIFFSDKRFAFSGYAEVAINTGFDQPRDTSSGDLELFYDTLIRGVPFLGFRLLPRWFWISELGLEFFQGAGETDVDFFPESKRFRNRTRARGNPR